MRYGLLVLLLWIPLLASADDIYQWTDNQGMVHFSDTPLPGATAVKLTDDAITADAAPADVPSIEQSLSPDKKAVQATPDAGKSTKSAAGFYSDVSIVQPLTEATYFNNRGEVEISIATKPDLAKEDQAVMLIDGVPLETNRNENVLRVQGVERGTHTVRVQIQDKDGKALALSNIITIYMRRPTVTKSTPLQTSATPLKSN